MSLSYWNSQFQITKLLPDFDDHLAEMSSRSAALDLAFTRIPTGPHPRQFVELTGTPKPGAPLPVFIHGGYWRALTAEMHRFVLPCLVDAAGVAANLEYRLLPEVRLPEIMQDMRRGLTLLAETSGCPLYVIGHSAGGHLALMARHSLPEHVRGVLSISGLCDLTPLPWTFLGEEVGLTARDIADMSPQWLLDSLDTANVTLAVGSDETPEFHRQAQMFTHTHGGDVVIVPGAHHMTVLDSLATPGGVLLGKAQMGLNRIMAAP